jgi:hypothetical protein
MNPRNKVLITLLSVLLVAVTVACSCSTITDLFNRGGSTGGNPEAMPGLAGVWVDTQENTVHTIVWTGSTYNVVSSIDDTHGNCAITSQNWNGSTLTWTYYVADTDVSVTITATSVSGNSMYNNWSSTNGNSGTDVFTRQ